MRPESEANGRRETGLTNRSSGAQHEAHGTDVSRRNRRTIPATLFVLLMFLTASTWLGCLPPPRPPPPTPPPADPNECSNGTAVPHPSDYFELVKDCEILLLIRDRLAGDGRNLYWSGQRPILEWRGVEVDDAAGSLRVVALRLGSFGLEGEIPAELARLTSLSVLLLYENSLTGTIPPELGELSNLEWLDLDHNLADR